MRVFLTVDVEPDCPPYLNTFRGITEGLGHLLDLLAEEEVPATFFTTGRVAERFPSAVTEIADRGHELGCHGQTHRPFTRMARAEAEAEIRASAATLRRFAPVISFRAPYLRFPDTYLDLLTAAGFLLDSSVAKYKLPRRRRHAEAPLVRVAVSATSSVLRLPDPIRRAYLGLLSSPVVLFVHPWEFVDLRRERLRWDCRFKTGPEALKCLRAVIAYYRRKGAGFYRLDDLV